MMRTIIMLKKDTLFDSFYLTKNLPNGIFEFLVPSQLLTLSLLNTKYYLLTAPFLTAPTHRPQKLSKKGPKRESKASLPLVPSIKVTIEKTPLHKWGMPLEAISHYRPINDIDFPNEYLSGKINSKCYMFYQHDTTGQVIYINRSLVDPNLNYNKLQFDSSDDIYEDIYEENMTHLAQIDFTSQVSLLARQREILLNIEKRKMEHQQVECIDYTKELMRVKEMKRIALILCFGGSFSIGIFEGGVCMGHKSDKKYVCRGKAGERQLTKDKQGGKTIKSMGSQIRRDQEKKHISNVGTILLQYKELLTTCEIVLLQAPGANRLVVINQKQNMEGIQNKLRAVCMTAKKANFSQIENIYHQICQIHSVKK